MTISRTSHLDAVADAHAFISDVERCMHEVLAHHAGSVVDAARAAIGAGGKRLRPVLVHAARPAHASIERWSMLAEASATAIELVHTATLIHDDMLDGAHLRRGHETAHVRWNNRIATAAGDLLFASAFRVLVDTRHDIGDDEALHAIELLASVSRQLAEGEALQADQTRDPSIHLDAYLERCMAKTGILFGAAMQLGALAGGAEIHDQLVMRQIGQQIGLAFQIADDVLDVAAPEQAAQLGKEPGADVRDGTITAPMLFACMQDPKVAELLRDETPDVRAVLQAINCTDGVRRASELARDTAHHAINLLDTLQDSFHVDAITALALASVNRVR